VALLLLLLLLLLLHGGVFGTGVRLA